MNKSMKMLFDEHAVIVKAIGIAKQLKTLIGKDNNLYENIVGQLIKFFRSYADKYHHYKEEEILFPEMSRKNTLLSDGVIKEMLENHEDFRAMIRQIESHLQASKYAETQAVLESYGEALLDHIAAENEEVFQTAESVLSYDELEKIGFRFLDCDRDLGDEQKEALEQLAEVLEKELFAANLGT
jgi:hemerythrin-like domain-containing protein